MHKLIAGMLREQKWIAPATLEVKLAKKILVVDDEPALVKLTSWLLTGSGYEVFQAGNGQEALRIVFDQKPDLVLLDLAMPVMDGLETCKRIRDVSDIPIIILTGQRNSEEDIARGLDCGADEYLLKPIGNKELMARVRATLRRAELPSFAKGKKAPILSDDYVSIDLSERRIMVNGERVRLTPREFKLLSFLVENAGSILTHRQVLEKVWGWEYVDDVDYVRIYISHLRQKIEPQPNLPKYILTEPGVGYYFKRMN